MNLQALVAHTQHASFGQLTASQYGQPQNGRQMRHDRSVLLHGSARTSTAVPALPFMLDKITPEFARVCDLFCVLKRTSAANNAALVVGLEPLTAFGIRASSSTSVAQQLIQMQSLMEKGPVSFPAYIFKQDIDSGCCANSGRCQQLHCPPLVSMQSRLHIRNSCLSLKCVLC